MPVVTPLTAKQMLDMVRDACKPESIDIVVDAPNKYVIYFENPKVFGVDKVILVKTSTRFVRVSATAGQTGFYIGLITEPLPDPIPYVRVVPPKP